MQQKQVELLKPYGTHVKGASLTLNAPVADLLIQRQVAKLVEPKRGRPKKEADTAAIEAKRAEARGEA